MPDQTAPDPSRVRPRSGSTTDDVTDRLREAILDGTLTSTTWLREAELASILQVSRTPVREALKRLADEQLVEREANRGCRVKPMTFDDALAVYVVRESLEGLAARAAALAQPETLAAELRHLQDQMLESVDSSPDLARLNLEFHRAIRQAASNPYLERFLIQVEHAVRRFGHSGFGNKPRLEEIHAEHEAIIEALEAADPDAAERAATHHMRMARDARIARMMRGIDRPS